MTERILPAREWYRLTGLEIGPLLSTLDPSRTEILVVEDEQGLIVGCWTLLQVLHAEGVWIDPAYRGKSSVARRLWTGMRKLVTSHGAKTFIATADSEGIAPLLARHGHAALPQEYVLWA